MICIPSEITGKNEGASWLQQEHQGCITLEIPAEGLGSEPITSAVCLGGKAKLSPVNNESFWTRKFLVTQLPQRPDLWPQDLGQALDSHRSSSRNRFCGFSLSVAQFMLFETQYTPIFSLSFQHFTAPPTAAAASETQPAATAAAAAENNPAVTVIDEHNMERLSEVQSSFTMLEKWRKPTADCS